RPTKIPLRGRSKTPSSARVTTPKSSFGISATTSAISSTAINSLSSASRDEVWPALPFATWKETAATLHMWTQIVGKIRLTLSPWVNHSWHVTLYLTARGLTTSPIPYGERAFEIHFDFVDHQLRIVTADRGVKII